MNQDVTRGIDFQRGFYHFLWLTVGPIFKRSYQFDYEPCDIKSKTFLLLSNHNTNLDPLCCVVGTKRHMKFVANEKLLQSFGGWFIKNLVNPIPRRKGASTEEVIQKITDNLRHGISVIMYAEGVCSWDGATGFISPKTAQLAKNAGVGLVTYRLDGGYLKYPHWADELRKGPIHGGMVREYTAQEVAAMSNEEIYEAICRDLYVDAYQYQEKRMDAYHCSRPAEHLELTCYICPNCHGIGTMHSKGDQFFCDCGLRMTYNPYGYFEGENLPFTNTLAWSQWQKEWLKEHAGMLRGKLNDPIIADKDLRILASEHRETKKLLTENGELRLFGDRLEILEAGKPARTLDLKRITKMGSFMNDKVFLTCDDVFYEITAKDFISFYRYDALWRTLIGKDYQ